MSFGTSVRDRAVSLLTLVFAMITLLSAPTRPRVCSAFSTLVARPLRRTTFDAPSASPSSRGSDDTTTFSSSLVRRRASSSASSSDAPPQRTVEGVCEAEQVIKKSRFIGISKHCASWEDARSFLRSVREEHPKSRHVCFGLVFGSDPVSERSSDDGEPTGTAGSPILGGVKGEGLSDTLCVVVRYSGGIKLGAGGLIRAYGGTARLVLRETPTATLIPRSTFRVSVPGASVGVLYDVVGNRFGGTVDDETYPPGGGNTVEATVSCETEHLDDVLTALNDATRGETTVLSND